jgi:hypothetical protein
MAAVEMRRRAVTLGLRLVPGAPGVIRLVGGDRERPEQLDQMRAALDAAEARLHRAPPTRADPEPFELDEGGGDRRTDRKRSGRGRGFRADHREVVIQRQAQRPIVVRLAGRDLAPEAVGERLRFGVGQMTFDVHRPSLRRTPDNPSGGHGSARAGRVG